MRKFLQKIKNWFRYYDNRREIEEKAARIKATEKFCYIGDIDSIPCIFIAGVPIYYIGSQPTNGKDLYVNIDDAPNIVRCIRGKHIKHAYGEEGM